ncbi:sulfatase-like hydrolase/transferase [Akkermansiaceae bacterium]|nr:sulfatase-like hydrolase/transferase [Akkermansiaceae bacterium]
MKILFILFSLLLFNALQAKSQPNIMVFLVDDMGVMDTSVDFLTDNKGKATRYPLNDFYRTPSMARLAKQGVRFNQFYAMSVCSPSRISLLTGQNAARHGATNWINPALNNRGKFGPPEWNWKGLKKGEVTLPAILAKEGYRTIHVGKAHLGPKGSEGGEPLNLGFEENVGGAAFGAPGSYYAKAGYGALTKRKSHAVPHLDEYHGSETFLTEALTLEARKRVAQSVKDGKPFFLHFAHYAVHAPFHSDPRFAKNYENSGKSKNAQAFATLIEGMDKSLGDMLDCFEELGVAENTLVIFLGDNGSDAPLGHQHEVACAAPLRGKKGAHYEGGMRVPFIAAWAKRNDESAEQKALGIPAGAIQPQVASVEDIFPTVLKVVGAKNPEGHEVDGLQLQTLLTGRRDETRKEQFLMHYPHGPHRSNYFTVWRDGDYKVIYHALPATKSTGNRVQFSGGNYEVYHLANDPFEERNLAAVKSTLLKEMMADMIERLERCGAKYPVDEAGRELKPRVPGR